MTTSYRSQIIPERPNERMSHARWSLGQISRTEHFEIMAEAQQWDERYGKPKAPDPLLLEPMPEWLAHIVVYKKPMPEPPDIQAQIDAMNRPSLLKRALIVLMEWIR